MMQLAPRKQSFSNIMINSLGSFVSGLIGSIIIIIFTFFISNYFNVVGMFGENQLGLKISPLFPFILSIITLLGTSICSFMTYHVLNMTDPEKYKKNGVIYGQLAIYQILCYILITPVYMYIGTSNFENILLVYLFHVMLAVFGTSFILEIFNNYRYLLVGFYGTIIGLFISSIFSLYILYAFGGGYAKMLILMVLLPLSNFLLTFIKQLIELLYHYYYKFTSLDPIGDIFYQIEIEEERLMREEEEKNSI